MMAACESKSGESSRTHKPLTSCDDSVALAHNQVRVVQASVVGSIIVNLLPILGTALLAGSVSPQEQSQDTGETQMLGYLVFVSVFLFMMPVSDAHNQTI